MGGAFLELGMPASARTCRRPYAETSVHRTDCRTPRPRWRFSSRSSPLAAVTPIVRNRAMLLLFANNLSPLSDGLLKLARERAAAGEHQIAVVLAYVACDLYTEAALRALLKNQGQSDALVDTTMSLVRDTTLADGRTRRLYAALTGDYPAGHTDNKIAPLEWWREWADGRELRHAVAHQGASVTPEQSASVLKAAAKYIDHVAAQAARGGREAKQRAPG